jgi:acyl dehydratase
MRAHVGRETAPYRLRIDGADLVRFASMLGYTEPWYVDEIEARRSRFGGLIAAPTYLIVMRRLEHQAFAAIDVLPPLGGGVDGGSVWKYATPIRAGDVITAVAHVAGYEERTTKLGASLFQTIESRYENQFGQLAVRQNDTRIYYA